MLKFKLNIALLAMIAIALSACGESADKAAEQAKDQAAEVVQSIDDEVVEPAAEVMNEVVEKVEDVIQHESLPATPPPSKELIHTVVYEQEMYKGWPYQEEARNLPEPEPETPAEESGGIFDKAKNAISDNTEQLQDVVVDKVSDVSGQSKEVINDVVEKGKDMLAAVTPDAEQPSNASSTSGKEHRINAEARVFNPAIVYIAPGDVIKFDNMTSHNSVTYVKPEAAKGWGARGKGLGKNIKIQLNEPGIYGYACDPHIGFGMVGVVVVGDVTADDVAATKQNAMDTLEGPYKRIIGKINKIQPTK